MKGIKVTKGLAFLVTMGVLLILGIVVMATPQNRDNVTYAAALAEIVNTMRWVSIAYMGWNVADNGVKGKFFRQELQPPDKEDV